VRILLVSHRFPPAHTAGTETYTEELAVHLAAAGHTVHVFTAEKDVGRRDLTLHTRTHRGLSVHELTQNLYLHHFRDTWDNPKVDDRFEDTLRDVAPDVVHFHHLLYLSAGLVAKARHHARKVLMTLHDFWLECPRFGQLVHADGTLCHTVDHVRCGTCLPSFPWRQSDLARTLGKVLAGVHSVTGVDLSGVARKASRTGAPNEPSAEDTHHYQVQAETRDRALRTRVAAPIDRFLAPSRFLADRLVAWGIPADRMEVLPSGVDRASFGTRPRVPRTDLLRVRFLGTQVHLKGPHVLLDAWARLPGADRARASLHIHGPDTFQPDYVADLRARAGALDVEVTGNLDRDGVAATLAATDVLVVPSLWFENRPLIVLEALASRTPLLVSDLGGLVELVEDGDSGWRFPAGDADALAARLADLIADPRRLDLPFENTGALLPTWADVAVAHLERYA